jgi:hypothetical protein
MQFQKFRLHPIRLEGEVVLQSYNNLTFQLWLEKGIRDNIADLPEQPEEARTFGSFGSPAKRGEAKAIGVISSSRCNRERASAVAPNSRR